MDAERLFFRINGLFCFAVAVDFLWNAGLLLRSSARIDPKAAGNLDQFLQSYLRDLAGGAPYLLSLVHYLPAMMMISLMLAFYLYLHRRSRPLSLLALIFGLVLSGMLIVRQFSAGQLAQLAVKFIGEPDATSRVAVFKEASTLYGLYLAHGLLVNRASIVAYAFIGWLFRKSYSFYEVIVGTAFLASSGVLFFHEISRRLLGSAGDSATFAIPALAFALAGVVLLRARGREPGED